MWDTLWVRMLCAPTKTINVTIFKWMRKIFVCHICHWIDSRMHNNTHTHAHRESVRFMILHIPFIPSDLIFSAFYNMFDDILQRDCVIMFVSRLLSILCRRREREDREGEKFYPVDVRLWWFVSNRTCSISGKTWIHATIASWNTAHQRVNYAKKMREREKKSAST